MGNSLSNCVKEESIETVKATWRYLIKRIKSILPYLVISMFVGIFVWSISNGWDFEYIKKYVWYIWGDILFLQCMGYPSASVCGVMWYLSSLFCNNNFISYCKKTL